MIIALDFETVFDADYTLSKLTTEHYVRDPRFEALCIGAYTRDGGREYVPQHRIAEYLASFDWAQITVIHHHAHFDGLILSHHYGIHPRRFICSLAMARGLNPFRKLSLDALFAEYGYPPKTAPYDEQRGKHWNAMSDDLQRRIMASAASDAQQTYELVEKMLQGGNGYPAFPREEMHIVDQTVKMFTRPRLIGNVAKLEAINIEEWTSKHDRLAALGVDEKVLASNDRFADLLRAEGVEVEMKEGKNGPIPAVAATDSFMQELMGDADERIRNLALARVDVRSTINETRSGRLAASAQRGRGAIPVYLNYFGAGATGRWSGGDRSNFQNLPRGGKISDCIEAPPGFKLIVCDASQIECRILNYMAGQWSVLDAFATGRDPYCELATNIFGKPVTRADDFERQVGKKGELSCGYGIGKQTFHRRLRMAGIDATFELAERTVDTYRETHPEVTELWREGDQILNDLFRGKPNDWRGLVQFEKGRMFLPNGASLVFNLKWDSELQSLVRLKRGNGFTKIWGGALVGETIQALARVYLSQTLIRIKVCFREYGDPVLLKHDEAVYLVPEADAERAQRLIEGEFCRAPTWLDGIPLGCESWIGDNYGHTPEARRVA